jgi:hypothetical protein
MPQETGGHSLEEVLEVRRLMEQDFRACQGCHNVDTYRHGTGIWVAV